MGFQTHFSDDYTHFYLDPKEINRKKEKRKRKTREKGAPRFAFSSKSKKGELSEKANLVRQKSLTQLKIFDDQRLYFVIKFADSIYWISDILKNQVLAFHLLLLLR